ncbi:MAG: hypothetical protein ACFFAE_02125 [Candidatus Hodarchaeota archaeon]
MEVEYQNKYVVKWCLDRKGPRICLQATTTENKLRTIKINSEGFNLELEDAEARDFLNILNQIAASTQFAPHRVVTVEQEITPEVKEEYIPEVKPPIKKPPIIEIPQVEEPVAPDVPDSSEIIQVLKESERAYAEITPSSPDDVSTKVSLEVEKPAVPDLYEEAEKEITTEEILSESFPIQEEPEVMTPEIETASFFQQSISKSPLEMLLEEDDEGEDVEVSDVSSITEPEVEEPYTPPIEPKRVYSPDDLETESFFSKFDTRRTVDLLQKPEPKPEPEPTPEFKRVVELEPAPKFVKKEPIKTEAERRAEIEKERAERRRRLWELTRGF